MNVLGLETSVANIVNVKTVQIPDTYLFNIYFCGFMFLFYILFYNKLKKLLLYHSIEIKRSKCLIFELVKNLNYQNESK